MNIASIIMGIIKWTMASVWGIFMGMNYELAKELKDNGFPFKYPAKEVLLPSGKIESVEDFIESVDKRVPIPTLSELIEACGIAFFDLRRCIDKYNTTLIWAASSINRGGYVMGKTPLEAVARLWLVLNKK